MPRLKRVKQDVSAVALPSPEATAQASRDRVAQLSKFVGTADSWKPATTTILPVDAVPTCFPYFDWKLGVRGYPLARIAVISGPSHHGKTLFALGLLASFVRSGNLAALVDAERAITAQFAQFAMGDAFTSPLFQTLPTSSYEKVRSGVRMYCDGITAGRESGALPKDATGLIVVDSIRKLVPDKLWDALAKDLAKAGDGPKRDKFGKVVKDGGVDGSKGRAGQIKAQFNAAWMDELVPLINDSRTTILIIAREHVRKGEGFGEHEIIEVGGGDAMKYDPSMRLRVVEDQRWYGAKGERVFAGGRHTIELHKTRYGARSDVVPTAVFHSSNGKLFPEGLDRTADVLELARELGEVTGTTWLDAHVGEGEMVKLGQGELQSLKRLREEPELLVKLEAVCRAKF